LLNLLLSGWARGLASVSIEVKSPRPPKPPRECEFV
jgi:hypothetical protein